MSTNDVRVVADALNGLVNPDEVLWAFSEADTLGADLVIFNFTIANCDYVEGANLILKYTPMTSKVMWARVEVLISSELPAKDFLSYVYSELIRLGGDVVVKKDGISAIFKVSLRNLKQEMLSLIREVCSLLKCKPQFQLVYSGYKVLEIG